jgi:hypothetical protein
MPNLSIFDGISFRGFDGISGYQGTSMIRKIVVVVGSINAYFTNDSTTDRYYTDDAKANPYFSSNI